MKRLIFKEEFWYKSSKKLVELGYTGCILVDDCYEFDERAQVRVALNGCIHYDFYSKKESVNPRGNTIFSVRPKGLTKWY